MKRTFVCLLWLPLVVSCSSGEGDTDDGGSDAREKNIAAGDWTSDFNEMVDTLKLPDDQAARLRKAFETRERVLADWWSRKGNRLSELEGQLADAVRSRNLSELHRIKTLAQPLRDELMRLAKTQQQALREALSSESRLAWDAHQLARRVIKLMEPLQLTDDQIAEIHREALPVAEAVAGEVNPLAAGYIRLERRVEPRVLTAQQRTAFEDIKKKHPLRSLGGE